jgi:hypothetical protein
MATNPPPRVYKFDFDSVLHENHRRHRAKPEVQSDDVDRITRYLENPVGTGIWRLSAKWIEESGISNDVWAELEKEVDGKESLQIRSGKRDRRIRVNDEWKKDRYTDVFGRITFLMVLFQFLAHQATGQPENESSFIAEDDDAQLILDVIDTTSIAVKYADALQFFRDNFWHESFSPMIQADSITRLKAGSFILLQGPRVGNSLVLISWLREPLQSLLTFLDTKKLAKLLHMHLE